MSYPGETTRRTTPHDSLNPGGDRLKDVTNAAADKVEEGSNAAVDGLKSAASYIGDKIGDIPGGDKVQRTAAAAADSVAGAAGYLRDTDMNRMASDMEELVKRNPGPSLLAAGVLGFLIGRSLSR